MISYFKIIGRPLNWVKFPKLMFLFGLFLESIMFPMMQISVGLMQKYLVNAVEYKNSQYAAYVVGLAVAVLIMVFLLNPLGDYLKIRSMRVYTNELRELTIKKLLSSQYSHYETIQTGEWMTRLRDNVDNISSIYTDAVFRLFMGVFYGGGVIAVMLSFSWQLSLAVIALSVCETLIMAKTSEKITKENRLLQGITEKQYQVLFDIIKALGFIKISSIVGMTIQKYEMLNDDFTRKNLEINKVDVFLNMLEEIFTALNLVLIFSFGILLYLTGGIDLGSVISFLFLQDGISYMISNLREFYSGYSEQIADCERVQELLNLESEEETEQANSEVIGWGDICIKDLYFRYQANEDDTLKGISLNIPANKVTVLYGPSGSGKSTLLKLLLALYPLERGSICVGQSEYKTLTKAAIRAHFSYVEQSPYLFHDTIEENIRCSNPDADYEEIVDAAKLASAHDFIMQKPEGYQTVISEHGSNFSGGEKQRIAIARAILRNSDIVIWDEATSAVDMENEEYLYDSIRELVRKGKTVLLVSHKESAQQLADHKVMMENGEIKEKF